MYETEDMEEVIWREPLGKIAHISTWNAPYWAGINVMVPALMAGHHVVYKPSEFAEATGDDIRSLFIEAGLFWDSVLRHRYS